MLETPIYLAFFVAGIFMILVGMIANLIKNRIEYIMVAQLFTLMMMLLLLNVLVAMMGG